jgi:hypothetical protein
LAKRLRLKETHQLDSHTVLVVSGVDDEQVVDALGIYLVALLAGVVRTNLRLSTALLVRTPDGQAQLATDVEKRLTPPASGWTVEDFNQNVRNPWIAECVGHALLAVRQRAVTPCLSGPVAAMTVPHANPTQQGLDLFAFYDDDGLPALAIGEAKATERNGGGRLTEATGFFRQVARGERDVDIRMQVVGLTEALGEELQRGLSGAFWHERSCYLPVIAHGDEMNLGRRRPALEAIPRPASQKRVISCRPSDYAGFFSAVADAMRSAVAVVNP